MKTVMVAAMGAAMLGGCAHDYYRTTGRSLNGPLPSELANSVMTPETFNGSDNGRPRRRDLIYGMVARSDVDCEDYLIGVSVVARNTEGLLSLGGLALSTASGVTTPERSAKLLAQLSALTGTSASALEETVFGGRDFQILYTAIQTGRRRDREQLYQRVENGEFDGWGYHSLVAMVTPYHLNCGLNYGMQQIAEAVEEQARETSRAVAPGRPVVAPTPPSPAPTR